MMRRLGDMTAGGKLLALVAVLALGVVGGWLGYNLGHWMATH